MPDSFAVTGEKSDSECTNLIRDLLLQHVSWAMGYRDRAPKTGNVSYSGTGMRPAEVLADFLCFNGVENGAAKEQAETRIFVG